MHTKNRPGTASQHLRGGFDDLAGDLERLTKGINIVDAIDKIPGGFVEYQQVRAAGVREVLGGVDAPAVDRIEMEMIVQNRCLCHDLFWERIAQKQFGFLSIHTEPKELFCSIGH